MPGIRSQSSKERGRCAEGLRWLDFLCTRVVPAWGRGTYRTFLLGYGRAGLVERGAYGAPHPLPTPPRPFPFTSLTNQCQSNSASRRTRNGECPPPNNTPKQSNNFRTRLVKLSRTADTAQFAATVTTKRLSAELIR